MNEDPEIARLRARVAELELGMAQRDEENEKLRSELEDFRRSKGPKDASAEPDFVSLDSSSENEILLPLEVIGIIASFLTLGGRTLACLA